MSASRLESHEPLVQENRRRLQRLRGLISPGLRRDQSAPITVIALSPPVPFHPGKVKSSTSTLTRSF